MKDKYKRTKVACYLGNISMAIIANLPALLFLTFNSKYGISYTKLGFLVVVLFFAQLIIDLIFVFYSSKFNISKILKIMPLLTFIGLVCFATLTMLFSEHAYIFMVFSIAIAACASGFAEVLLSPVIAAIPSENKEREMSILHSCYAWGVVVVVLLSTIFLHIFTIDYWYILMILWSLVPLYAFFISIKAEFPSLVTLDFSPKLLKTIFNKKMLLCMICIAAGGASEVIIGQWCSSYIETNLNISKISGDILGVAAFGLMLGTGRQLYSKYGKNLNRVLILGSLAAFICYITAALSSNTIIVLTACATTGFFVSMLWPGTLLQAEKVFPTSGVVVFALMAAGGDAGASLGPQLIGLITDIVSKNESITDYAMTNFNLLPDEIGFKTAFLIGSIFPLIAFIAFSKLSKIVPTTN